MPTEKEMEDIIVDCWKNHKGLHWYRAAAHDIAEKMKQAEEAKCAQCPYKQDMETMKKGGAIAMFP